MNLTKSEQAVLRSLAIYSGEDLYESQIAKNSKVSAGSTNQSLKKLLKRNMVLLEKKGNMNFYSLNLDNPLVRQFKVSHTIASLAGLIHRLKSMAKIIILFGSCAEGTDTQDSDIDIAVVSQAEQETRKIVKKENITREIQALIFAASDFMRLAENDKPLYERIQKGVVLWRRD
ncbi:nucleotidyltransferase domain-containing protein [Candidatus Omnitrophota bacterium]